MQNQNRTLTELLAQIDAAAFLVHAVDQQCGELRESALRLFRELASDRLDEDERVHTRLLLAELLFPEAIGEALTWDDPACDERWETAGSCHCSSHSDLDVDPLDDDCEHDWFYDKRDPRNRVCVLCGQEEREI